MKKIRCIFLVVAQIMFASVLTAQTIFDTVCVGDVKNYFVYASFPEYSNPSGDFQGGVDTVYQWVLSDNTKGILNPAQIGDTSVDVTWVASGDVVLTLIETIQDSLSGVSEITNCSRTNTLNVHIFDTISNFVLAQPQNASSVLGGSVIFNAGLLVGVPQTFGTLTYQWQYSNDGFSSWDNIAGANSPILTVNVMQVEDAGYYRCQVSSGCNQVNTSAAYLLIRGVPTIYLHPQNATICEGSPEVIIFRIGANCDDGDAILYQWQKSSSPDGPWENITDAVDSAYVINNPQVSDEGYYKCVVNSVLYPSANVSSNYCHFEVIDNMVVYFTTNNITCYGANNGSILVDSVLNGYAPFTYLWNTGATTNTIADLAPGSYSVQIIEGSSSGCSIEKTVEIEEPLPIRLGIDTSIWEYAQWINGQDNQYVEDITIDKINHNYYQTGSFETELKFGTSTVCPGNSGSFDMFVSKVSGDGEVAWSRHAGGSNDSYGKGVGVDSDGNVYVGGSFQTTICFYNADNTPGPIMTSTGFENNNYDYDGFIVKYNANGVYQNSVRIGGIFNDYIHAVYVNKDGQIFVTGSFEGDITIQGQTISSGSAANVFVARLNNDLSLRWLKAIENQPFEQVGNAIITDVADNTYISGYYQGENELQQDLFIARFDYAGTLKWVKTVNGTGFLSCGSLAVDYSECVYHTGSFTGNAQLRASDGSAMHNYVSAGGSDGFIQKFDRNGYLRWATTVGGTGNDSIKTITTDVLGNTYIAGVFSGSISFNNHTFTSTPNAANSFVAKYSNVESSHPYTQSIPPVWGNVINGIGNQDIKTIAIDNDQNIMIGGDFSLVAQFGDSVSLSANHPKDAFVAKLKETYEPKSPLIVDAFCPEDPSGSIQLFISGGTLPYNYVWSTEGDSAILNNIESGRYWFWIGDYYNTWNDSVCGFNGSIYVNHIHNAPVKPNYLTVDNNDFCAGSLNPNQITLMAHTIPTNITDSIYWMEGDCFTGTIINGSTGHPAADEYTMTIPAPTDTTTYYAYWVSEYCGRSLCATITVNVKPQPIMPEAIVADTNNFCKGSVDSIRFTAVGGSGRILEWLSSCNNNAVIGTGTRFSIIAPLDTTTYYARWKNDCGASECREIAINVTPYPNTTIYNLSEEYCSNESIDTLIGMPVGGTWNSVPGLTVISSNQATFNPALAFQGLTEITYTASYGGCDSTFIASTVVHYAPQPEYIGLDSVYCYDAANVLLTGNYAPHGTFSCNIANAIENIGYGKAMFKPSIAGVGGPYYITYTYEDINTGCIDSIVKTTSVIRPNLVIEGLPPVACTDEEYIIIHGLVDGSFYGGTFTGIGIAGHLEQGVALFDPNLEPGTYTITLSYTNYFGCSNYITQSIQIVEGPISPDTVYVLGGESAYCYQTIDSMILVAEGGSGDVIEWFQGSCGDAANLIDTGRQIQVAALNEAVSYFVRWSNGCGSSECLELPITVYELPEMQVEGVFSICSNDSTVISSAKSEGCEYIWMDIETGSLVGNGPEILLTPDESTWYRQIANNEHHCMDSIDFQISVLELPALDLGEDLFLFSCDSVEIIAGDGIGFDHYLWQDNSTESTYWVKETGDYYVMVYNDGCSITDTIYVELCTDKFFVPNAFSPNADGLNDYFRPLLSDMTLRAEMYIYARTGGLVFQTDNITEGWDGTDMKGAVCPSGTYAYVIKYHVKVGNGRTMEKTASGAVILLK